MSPISYRPDIDGLRAIAVLPVLFFHAGFAGFGGGFIGVDVFFVISGYLITKLLVEDPRFSLLNFYERRARRILPALFVVILACSIVAYIFFMPEEFVAFGKSVVATALLSSNMLFWSETGYFDAPPELKPLLHTWSLAVEEQFYVVYPLLLMLGSRFLNRRWIALLLPLFLLSLAFSIWLTYRDQEAAFYLAPSRAWEFLLGCLLAVGAVPAVKPPLLRETLGIVGVALIAWSVVTYSEIMVFPGLSALVPCAGAAILIWLNGAQDTIVGRMLASRALVFIGLLSYSLYLWHWPILVFARYIAMHELSFTVRLALVLSAFPLAYLSWRYVELPVRRGTYWKGRRLLAACAAAGIASVGFGVAVAASNGMPSRIAPETLALQPPAIHDRRDCHFVTIKRVDAGDLCIRGAPDRTPSFVLVGDSHADALSPGVFAGAASAGVAGYQFTAPGYRPLPGLRGGDLTERFMAFLDEHPEIRLVVIAGFWQHQAEGMTFRNRPHVFKDEAYDGSGLAYNKVSFRRGLEKLVKAFPDRRFAIVEDIPVGPELAVGVARRLAHIRSVLGAGAEAQDARRFGIGRPQYEAQLACCRSILHSLADLPNVTVVKVIDQLCDEQFCHGARDGALLYRNGDHLSPRGAMLFADTFAQLLAQRDLAQPSASVGTSN